MSLDSVSPLLAQLVHLPNTSDVLINGPNSIWVDQGSGLQRLDAAFESERVLDEIARSLMAAGQRHIDFAHPICDVMLPSAWFEGSGLASVRAHAVLAGAVSPFTSLSLRVHGRSNLQLADLVDRGMLSSELAADLVSRLRAGASLLISGVTGSGKTTLLRALLAAVPGERRVLLEDIAELGLEGDDLSVALQVRQANSEGKGFIGLSELLRQSLRMRPDRLVVGELRGAELLVLLEAANSGHTVAATIHARSVAAVSERLAAIGLSQGLAVAAVDRLARNAFDIVLQVARVDGTRRVVE